MAYEIKSGDTLSEIAQKNNTSVAEIMASNPQISNANQIQAGASLNLGSRLAQLLETPALRNWQRLNLLRARGSLPKKPVNMGM